MPTPPDISKEEGEDNRVHRLTSIVVEEVSPVDLAANQRRFLIAKRREPRSKTMPTELQSDGRGGLTSMRTQTTKAPGDAPDGAPGDTGAAPPPSEAPPQEGPAQISLSPEAKDELSQVLDAIAQKISELQDMVSGATAADGAPVPPELLSDFQNLSDLLMAVQDKYSTPAAASENTGDQNADGSAAQGDSSTAVTARHPAAKASISRGRFLAIVKTWELIDALLRELEPIVAAPRATTPEAQAAQMVEAAKRLKAKQGSDKALLQKSMSVAEAAVRRVTELEVELAKARSMPAARNSAPTTDRVSTNKQQTAKKSDSWGSDFNRPLTRDTVPADESFFDEND